MITNKSISIILSQNSCMSTSNKTTLANSFWEAKSFWASSQFPERLEEKRPKNIIAGKCPPS